MEVRDLKFEEINLGDSAQFEHSFSNEDVRKFAELSGDYNPLHLDAEYVKTTQFEKPLVHGVLVSSLISRLIGMHLPGKRALYLSQTMSFKNPVFIDDNLRVRGEVMSKSESTRIITLKTVITNQNEDVVLDGEAKVRVL